MSQQNWPRRTMSQVIVWGYCTHMTERKQSFETVSSSPHHDRLSVTKPMRIGRTYILFWKLELQSSISQNDFFELGSLFYSADDMVLGNFVQTFIAVDQAE